MLPRSISGKVNSIDVALVSRPFAQRLLTPMRLHGPQSGGVMGARRISSDIGPTSGRGLRRTRASAIRNSSSSAPMRSIRLPGASASGTCARTVRFRLRADSRILAMGWPHCSVS